jgi:hypothetical protein
MSLTLATLIPGLLLLALGGPLLMKHSGYAAALKAFPRSKRAAYGLFGAGTVWFLNAIWHLSAADFGDYHVLLFVAFAVITVLSFRCVPDFLAVRGACVVVLMGAMPLLDAAYMEEPQQRKLMVAAVYVAIALAIWLGAQPYRLRDFIAWLFARPGRARAVGVALAAYGLLLCGVAFTY